VESYTDILRGHERSGRGLETVSFLKIVMEDGIRRRAICFVCLQAKYRIKAVNSAIVYNSRFKFTCDAPHWFIKNDVNFLQSNSGYVKITALSEVYLDSHRRDYSENPHRVPQFNLLKF